MSSRAVSTDILHLPARVVVTAADRLSSANGPQCPRGVERRERTADDHPDDDHGPPSAALRPSASGSRSRHRERNHRHGSRGPSLDGPRVAQPDTEGRGEPGRDGAQGIGTPARSPGHQWLFLHSPDGVTTVRRLVAFYVDEHNRGLPHSAFRGQTPDEMYFGTGDAVPADLMSRAVAARRARVEANRSAACGTCPSIDAAA